MNDLTVFGSQTLQIALQLSFHASIVVVGVLLVQAALGKKISARWRYSLWGIVVVRLLVPWNYEVPVLRDALPTAGVEIATTQKAFEYTADVPRSVESTVSFEGTSRPVDTGSRMSESVTAGPPLRPASEGPGIWTLLSGLWLLGVVGFPCVIFFNHVRTTLRLLRSSSDAPAWVSETLKEVREEFGIAARPTILTTSEIHSPTLLGAIRPKILLPSKLTKESSREEMRLFLLHELTHLRRGDIWFSWLWCLALSVHWFNPLMWWTGIRIRKDRELACDESVLRRIGDNAKDDYACALLRAVAHISGTAAQRYRFGLVGIAENKAEMTRRIESVLAPIVRSERLRVTGALILAVVLCASFVQLVPVERVVDVETIFQEQLANLRLLETIDLRVSSTRTINFSGLSEEQINRFPSGPLRDQVRSGELILKIETRFVANQEKYYFKYSTSPTQEGVDAEDEYAFDGTKHQMLHGASRMLTVSKSNLMSDQRYPERYPERLDFLEPFQYIAYFKTGWGLTLEVLKSEEVWKEVAESSRVIGESIIDDMAVVIIETIFPDYRDKDGKSVVNRIYCAKEYGYYPIQYEYLNEDGVLRERYKVKGLKEFTDLDGQRIYIHGSSLNEHWGSSPKYELSAVTESKIDQTSIRFNESVDQSIFQIPVSMALYYRNLDSGETIRIRPGEDQNIDGLFEDIENEPEPSGSKM